MRLNRIAYVEGSETGAVLIECLVVELDELLCYKDQSRFDRRSARRRINRWILLQVTGGTYERWC
jgi:hypothetical protein